MDLTRPKSLGCFVRKSETGFIAFAANIPSTVVIRDVARPSRSPSDTARHCSGADYPRATSSHRHKPRDGPADAIMDTHLGAAETREEQLGLIGARLAVA